MADSSGTQTANRLTLCNFESALKLAAEFFAHQQQQQFKLNQPTQQQQQQYLNYDQLQQHTTAMLSPLTPPATSSPIDPMAVLHMQAGQQGAMGAGGGCQASRSADGSPPASSISAAAATAVAASNAAFQTQLLLQSQVSNLSSNGTGAIPSQD